MTISYQWLSEYLPVTLQPDELSHILTAIGLEVEHMEKSESVKGGLDGLVIGKVMACSQHPNADKLKLTKVDIGTGTLLNIVCGAPNVAEGQTVVVAPVGTTVHPVNGEPFLIKPAKIRGEESQGMICAEDEIGLGESHAGIIVLNDEVAIGTPAKEYYKIPASDIVYEIGLTPNRMDAMSHLGVARDVCAYLSNRDGKIVSPLLPVSNMNNEAGASPVSIDLRDTARCARYAGVCIDGITVGPSPEWMQNRLKAIGLRPINVVVDITNYVLHECGQPLHAFDCEAIAGNTVVVQTLAGGTKFITLDEKERELHAEDLMICNAGEAMCIAGVFGGLKSGVSDKTTAVFLESAWFNNNSIRKTSLRHGLRTDAATRFEKGADINMVPYALKRAAQLICELAGGHLAGEWLDVYPQAFTPVQVAVRYQQIRDLAGKNYPDTQIKTILSCVGFTITEESAEGISVQVPSSKPDISLPADVVEEIMRIDGLDNIPFTGKIAYSLPERSQSFTADVKAQFAQVLTGKGFQEIFTNSITNSAFYPDRDDLVRMMNNLSAELDCMRPSMRETGLLSVAYNLNRKNNQLHFFEFGKVYRKTAQGFDEKEQLCFWCSGNYSSNFWKAKDQKIDIYFMKGIIENLLLAMNIEFSDSDGLTSVLFRRRPIGFIEQVSPALAKQFDLRQDTWFAELDWETIHAFYENQKTGFKALPKFPFVQRDLAMILDRQVRYEDVQKTVKMAKSKLLREVKLFDVFESEKLGAGKKSYAINLSFYNDEKTLTDAEVEQEMKMIIASLEGKLGANVRGTA